MTTPKKSNTRSGSTPSEWEWAKIRRRSKSPAAPSRSGLSRLEPHDSVTLTVRYLGGSEAWMEVRARGHVLKVPGHRLVYDLMTEIWR